MVVSGDAGDAEKLTRLEARDSLGEREKMVKNRDWIFKNGEPWWFNCQTHACTMENGHLTVKMSPMTNGNRWPLQMRQSSTRSRRMRDRAAGGTELGTTGAAGGVGKTIGTIDK